MNSISSKRMPWARQGKRRPARKINIAWCPESDTDVDFLQHMWTCSRSAAIRRAVRAAVAAALRASSKPTT